jgi:toxin ParE1/3/4
VKPDVSEDARADIRGIHMYSVKQWGSYRAGTYIDDLRDCMKALARGDLSGTCADDVSPGLRRQVSGSHVIWFRVTGEALRIVRVLHQRQDVDRDMA